MNKSKEIKAILVNLAADGKLPSDMTQLDFHVFDPIFESKDDDDDRADPVRVVEDEFRTSFGFTISDILYEANEDLDEDETPLTQLQAHLVMNLMDKHGDASVGMNWHTIAMFIEQVRNFKPEVIYTDVCGACMTSISGQRGYCQHGHDNWISDDDFRYAEKFHQNQTLYSPSTDEYILHNHVKQLADGLGMSMAELLRVPRKHYGDFK